MFFWKKLNSRKLHELIHGVIHSTLSSKLTFYPSLIRIQYIHMYPLPLRRHFLTFLIKGCEGYYKHLRWRPLQQYLRALSNVWYMVIWNKRKSTSIRKLLCVCIWQKWGMRNFSRVNRCVKIAQLLWHSQSKLPVICHKNYYFLLAKLRVTCCKTHRVHVRKMARYSLQESQVASWTLNLISLTPRWVRTIRIERQYKTYHFLKNMWP